MSRKLGKITRKVVEIEDTSKTGGSHFLARKNLTSIFHTRAHNFGYCQLLGLKHYSQFKNSTFKGSTGRQLKNHIVLLKSQTIQDLSISIFLRSFGTAWVFEPPATTTFKCHTMAVSQCTIQKLCAMLTKHAHIHCSKLLRFEITWHWLI